MIAVCSDIHGDDIRFEMFLDQIPDVPVYVNGDITGTGGDLERLAELVREHAAVVTFGNHDARHRPNWPVSAVEYEPGGQGELDYAQAAYSEESLAWLGTLPERIETDQLVMSHANPYTPSRNYCGYPATNYTYKRHWLRYTGDLDGRTMILGHTHNQGSLVLDKFQGHSGLVVNPGSLGDNGEYALIDLETHDVQLEDINP